MRQIAYRHYLLLVLTVIVVFNYVDRLALGIVLENIKADLKVTDTELGFLTGMAFALFYSVMGVPLARWADRGNRVTIISLTTALWSMTVALCGMAGSFAQLLLIRVGVAVGEAGCIPPAFSLIADYFSRAERPRAAAIYGLGAPIAGVIGFFLAGWLNQFYGWRVTFMLLGLPGLGLSVVAWFTLREPRRAAGQPVNAPAAPDVAPMVQPTLLEVFVTLWTNRTFRHLLLSLSVFFFFGYGIVQWQPTFFIRSYGLTTGEIGTWFAAIFGVAGIVGSLGFGDIASRHAPNDERRQLQWMALAIASSGVLAPFVYLAPNAYVALAVLGLTAFAQSAVNGPLFATVQTLVPERMRAMSFALLYLFANLIGMGLGPLATGALSDAFRPWAGEESLRYALLTLTPGYFWVAWHAWRASTTVVRDVALSHEREARAGNGGTHRDAGATPQTSERWAKSAASRGIG